MAYYSTYGTVELFRDVAIVVDRGTVVESGEFACLLVVCAMDEVAWLYKSEQVTYASFF